jgi:large subunit ribosomal protein L22
MRVEAKATIQHLRTTPRKARLVADAVRGKMVSAALPLLEYGIKRTVSQDIAKLVKSAVANLQNKNADASVNVDELRIKEIRVDEGPVLKRFRARAQGRVGRILKYMCHISVTVSN